MISFCEIGEPSLKGMMEGYVKRETMKFEKGCVKKKWWKNPYVNRVYIDSGDTWASVGNDLTVSKTMSELTFRPWRTGSIQCDWPASSPIIHLVNFEVNCKFYN